MKEDVNNVFQQPLGFDYAVLPPSGRVPTPAGTPGGLRRSHLQHTYRRTGRRRDFEDKTSSDNYESSGRRADLERCFGYTCRGAPVDSKRSLDVPQGKFVPRTATQSVSYPRPRQVPVPLRGVWDIISPLVGVREQVCSWMKIAALPTFRKLYGRINSDLKKGGLLFRQPARGKRQPRCSGKKAIVVATAASFEQELL